MSRQNWLAVWLAFVPSALAAQGSLQVLRHTPGDSATPGMIISVMFDRPVAGSLDRTVDPTRIMRLDPAVPGTVTWRDPVTLRFTPTNPMEPGTRLTVTVDTGFTAVDGSRLAQPYRFVVRIPGPTPLERLTGTELQQPGVLGVHPALTILYSAPVNLDSVSRGSRIEFIGACSRTSVAVVPVLQRVVRPGEFPGVGGYDRDTTADRYWRVVELTTRDPLPDGCRGFWHIPSFDPARPSDTWKYQVSTPGPFELVRPRCLPGPLCEPGSPRIAFSTRPRTADIQRYVRLAPAVPFTLDSTRECAYCTPTWALNVATPLEAGAVYRVRVDSALRDVYGRALTGDHERVDTVGNFYAQVWAPSGTATVPRNARHVKVDYINAATLTVTAVPIPDSLRARLLTMSPVDRYTFYNDTLKAALRDTFHLDVAVNALRDIKASATVPLPSEVGREGGAGMYAVRVRVKTTNTISASLVSGAPGGMAPSTRIPLAGSGADLTWDQPFGLLVQLSDLAPHTRIAGDSGAVFVTDLASGGPVSGAALTLFDADRRVLSVGLTDTNGLARLTPTDARVPQSAIVRDSVRVATRLLEVGRGGERSMFAVTGGHDEQHVYVPVSSSLRYMPLISGGRAGSASLAHASIITDRDIYRPGEIVYAKMVARTGTLGALSTPGGDSIRWHLAGGAGQARDTLWARTTTLSPYGTTSDSVLVPLGAQLGSYTFGGDIRVRGAWLPLTASSLRVVEYRAPEFRIAIAGDTAVVPSANRLAVALTSTYLFGPPVAGARVQWSARNEVRPVLLPKALRDSGYAVGAPPFYLEFLSGQQSETIQGSATSDREGKAQWLVPVETRGLGGPGVVRMTAAVTDAANQTVSISNVVSLPRPAFYLAARQRVPNWPWRIGAPQTLDVVAITPAGARISNLRVRMHVTRRHCALIPGQMTRVCTTDTVSRATALTRTVAISFQFTPRDSGQFNVFFETTDSRGRSAMAVLPYLFTNATGRSPNASTITSVVGPFSVTADSTPHRLGDTALVRVISPFALADAWITREREGVIEQRRLTVREGLTTLRVPLTERDAPSIWVGVTLIRRAAARQAGIDTIWNEMRTGYVELQVDSTAKQLRVDVASSDTISEPGDSVTIRLRVRDVTPSGRGRGAKGEVLLWAVDEGVLALTDFQTPALLSRVYERGGLGAPFRTVLTPAPWRIIVPRGRGLFLASVVIAGGDQDGTNELEDHGVEAQNAAILRSNFRTTAFFLASIVTDDSGFAEVRAKLPDNLTTYRLMAAAVTDGDRYGSGESSLMTTRDLVVRPALPRFVRAGDELTAAAVVSARTATSDAVRVRSLIDGAEIPGDATASFSIERGASRMARFAMRVPIVAPADATRIRFDATGRNASDAVEITLPIRPEGTPRTHTIAGMVVDSTMVRFTLPADIDPVRSRITISFGNSPLAAIRSDYERIRDYPYRNSEQVASAGSALLALTHAQRALGVSLGGIDSTNVLADLQRAVDVLSRREFYGWILLWPPLDAHPCTDPWLTAYAGTFLLNAQRAGATVRPSLLAAIRSRLGAYARDSVPLARPDSITGSPAERRGRMRAWLGARVAATRFLRDAGAPELVVETELLRLAPLMAWEDRVVLMELMAHRPGAVAQARAMLDSAWMAARVIGNRIELADSLRGVGPFPSHIRPAARLLVATMRIQPDNPRLGALVETVVQQGMAEQRRAWNTQDYASAAIALADFAAAQRGSALRRITVHSSAGSSVLTRTIGAGVADTSASLAGLVRSGGDSATVTLSVSADRTSTPTPLYYAISVTEIPRTRPVTPDVSGLVVERWFESFETGMPVSEVTEGDLVRVKLQVTVPADRLFVALEDMLPAGLEPIDLSLRTSSTLGPFATTDFARSQTTTETRDRGQTFQGAFYGRWDSGWWTPWEYKEMRDDRVVYFTRQLFAGTYTASYVARATTPGRFVLPPAHAEEMYNPAVQGRSSGGVFVVRRDPSK